MSGVQIPFFKCIYMIPGVAQYEEHIEMWSIGHMYVICIQFCCE